MKTLFGTILLAACAIGDVALAQTCVPVRAITRPILRPGSYCLTQSVIGRGMVIAANNVTLDLRGFSITRDPTIPLSGTTGIYAFERNGITVRNGTISGFETGVNLDGGHGTLRTEQLNVTDATRTGIAIRGYGSLLASGNTVFNVTGPRVEGIVLRGDLDPITGGSNAAIGIENNRVERIHSVEPSVPQVTFRAVGVEALAALHIAVRDNVVMDVSGVGSPNMGISIRHWMPFTLTVTGNFVINPAFTTRAVGILIEETRYPGHIGPLVHATYVANSTVQNFIGGIWTLAYPTTQAVGVPIDGALYQRNVVIGASLPYTGGQLLPDNVSR
jgi:hypothetical protein